MSEHDPMEQLLAQAMSAPVPTLSPDFDRRVLRLVKPRRLSRPGRFTLVVYSAVALIVSVWNMRQSDMDWMVIAVAVMAPIVVVAIAFRRDLAAAAR